MQKKPFRRALVPLSRFAVRAHLYLIMGGTLASGWVFSRIFLKAGIESMAVRYSLGVMAAYGSFLIFARLWLGYLAHRAGFERLERAKSGERVPEALDAIDIFPDADLLSAPEMPDLSLDADDVFGAIIAVVLFALAAFVIFWGAYVLIEIPMLWLEGIFHGVLAAALVKAAKRIDDEDFIGSVFKQTWWLALLILIVTALVGASVQRSCPAARTLSRAIECKEIAP